MSFDDGSNVKVPTGVFSGLVKITKNGGDEYGYFSLYWRPTMLEGQEQDRPRWLPVFLDVETTDGASPSFVAAINLAKTTADVDQLYYSFIVRPDYPQSIPLPKMGTTNDDEIEFKAIISKDENMSASTNYTVYIDMGFEVLS